MDDLRVLPVIVLGLGVLLVWGGLTGQSPVQRIKGVLTQGGVQSGTSTAVVTTAPSVNTSATYTVRRDYLA